MSFVTMSVCLDQPYPQSIKSKKGYYAYFSIVFSFVFETHLGFRNTALFETGSYHFQQHKQSSY